MIENAEHKFAMSSHTHCLISTKRTDANKTTPTFCMMYTDDVHYTWLTKLLHQAININQVIKIFERKLTNKGDQECERNAEQHRWNTNSQLARFTINLTWEQPPCSGVRLPFRIETPKHQARHINTANNKKNALHYNFITNNTFDAEKHHEEAYI